MRLVAGNADRPGITYSVLPVLSRSHALGVVVQTASSPLLVFCRTRNDTEVTARAIYGGVPISLSRSTTRD